MIFNWPGKNSMLPMLVLTAMLAILCVGIYLSDANNWTVIAIVAVYSLIILRLKHSPSSSVSKSQVSDTRDSEVTQDVFERIRNVSEIIGSIGPQRGIDEVIEVIVDSGRAVLDTQKIVIFAIDPCTGMIECRGSESVNESLRSAFLDLYSNNVSDREQRDPWTVDDVATAKVSNIDAQRVMIECGIHGILACPINSDASSIGMLVAFYSNPITDASEKLSVIAAIAAQGYTAISYAQAIEESRYMLDDLAGTNQQLALQATVDGLTGLVNHRSFQQMLSDMCAKRGRSSRVFSLAMIDVDHFKLFNDTHGHREGDSVLQLVARAMNSALRQGDVAARYGGEEFALIINNASKQASAIVAERVRRAVCELPYRKGVVTVSVGLAEFPGDATTPGELIENADKALYHAKITGRNRVCVWGDIGAGSSKNVISTDSLNTSPAHSVLVVEDSSESSCDEMKEALAAAQYNVVVANSSSDAIEILKTRVFDIALVSTRALPGEDVKSIGSIAAIHPNMPIVILAPSLDAAHNREALRRGASDVLLKPFNKAELPVVIERNIERRRIERQKLSQKSADLMFQAIDALASAIDAKDHYTAGHTKQVTALALAIADELRISNEERYALELAAKLHDIGKIALPDSALNKQSPLTEEEWDLMREHPATGAKIVGTINELAYVSTIIRHHHERLDGTGYPDGLRGSAIPYLSRIIAVADAYDAMTSERAHRSRLSATEAIEEISRQSDVYYSTDVVAALKSHLISRGDILAHSCEKAA